MDLTGKVAVVTGGSKGIGAGIARSLAAAGAAVAVVYSSDTAPADTLVDELTSAGHVAIAVRGDVGIRADARRIFEEANARLGAVDILVNNAGRYSFGPFESVTEAEFHRQVNTNVLGLFLMMQEYLRQAPPTGGSIVNISTAGVDQNNPGSALYVSTKSAANATTRILAKELGPRGIRVNAIAPGSTRTEGAETAGVTEGSEAEKSMIARTPLGRMGAPEDIGPVAVFLASDAARWVTGEVIHASGGQF